MPSDKPKKLADLRQKASASLAKLRKILKSSVSKEIESALNAIEEYMGEEQNTKTKKLGFSVVKQAHLDAIGVSKGAEIKWTEKLRKLGENRKARDNLSARFKDTKRCLDQFGLSPMEDLHRARVLNYILESADRPVMVYPAQPRGNAKVAPEFHVSAISFDDTNGGRSLELNGYIDFVSFVVSKDDIFTKSDVGVWDKAKVVVGGHSCLFEVKRGGNALNSEHTVEGVAQAVTTNEHFGKPQRFVLTDGDSWQFCLLHEKVYHTSYTLEVSDSICDEVILTALDEWLWYGANSDSYHKLWKFEGGNK